MARHILAELDELGEDGWAIERRLLTERCKLRCIPDEGVEEKDSALQALHHLKELVIDQRLIAEDRPSASVTRRRGSELDHSAGPPFSERQVAPHSLVVDLLLEHLGNSRLHLLRVVPNGG